MSRTVLIVEDNPDDVLLTKRALERNRLANEIEVAEDGQAALDYLLGREGEEWQRPLPQLILLDLQLPKVGGIDVLKQIRSNERTRRLPVVVLTSSDEEQDVVQSYDLGANSYIRKPVDFERVQEAINQLGLYWLVMNIPPVSGD
jgi:CheY-like chemotaxis protein